MYFSAVIKLNSFRKRNAAKTFARQFQLISIPCESHVCRASHLIWYKFWRSINFLLFFSYFAWQFELCFILILFYSRYLRRVYAYFYRTFCAFCYIQQAVCCVCLPQFKIVCTNQTVRKSKADKTFSCANFL